MRRRLDNASLLFENRKKEPQEGNAGGWRLLKAGKGNRQILFQNFQKKKKHSHADLLILAPYMKLIFRLMTTRTGQLESGLLWDTNCQHMLDHQKRKKVPEKHLFLLYWLCQSLWLWKRWEYQTTWPASWEICIQVRKQQLELDMEQQTCSK